MYRAGKQPKSRRRRIIFWLVLLLLVLGLAFGAYVWIRHQLQPRTVITKTVPRVSKVIVENKTTHYDEPDFSLDLPVAFQPVQRPSNVYKIYAWQTSEAGTKGQELDIYQDVIPPNFAVNKVLVVEGQGDQLRLNGTVSDNCATFTRGLSPAPGQVGVPAKWQNIAFLCDQFNQERDIIGTSSSDGVNTVILKSPSRGTTHPFFFSYSNQAINPDYTVFYNALRSLRMQ